MNSKRTASLATAVFFAGAAAWAQDATLVTINGTPILRSTALQRAWQEYGATVLNEMADEIIIQQEAARLKVKPSAKAVDARLKRIRDQFPDEATFKAKLLANGANLDQIKARIEDQILREDLLQKALDLKVGDDEVKTNFEANKEKLGTPESVHLRQILVATQKEADDFAVAIRAGADFAKLASQESLDATSKNRGGDLGWISRGLVIPEIEKAAFAMKPGDVTVVRTNLGWHLIGVEAVRAAKPAEFLDVEKEIRASLLADKITKAWPGYLQSLRSKTSYQSPQPPPTKPAPAAADKP